MITLQKEPFLQAIKAIKSSCGKANLQPILSTIHLTSENGGLILTATDINNSARAIIEANITKPIDVCINAEKLDLIISRLNDTITLDVEDAYLIIKSGNAKFDLLWLNSNEYPQPDFNLANIMPIVLSEKDFISGINKTIFATQSVEGQVLNGVCLTLNEQNGFEFAATDGNRLCQIKFDTPTNIKGQYILPKKVLIDLSKVTKDEIKLYTNGDKIVFETGNYLFTTALLNGKYPQYTQFIPTDNQNKVEMNKAELLQALETVAIMVNDRTNICKLKFTDNMLELTANCDNGKSKDCISITSNIKNAFNIGFNYRYLIEGLKVIDSETISFEMKDDKSACLIIGGNNYIQVVMPIRLTT